MEQADNYEFHREREELEGEMIMREIEAKGLKTSYNMEVIVKINGQELTRKTSYQTDIDDSLPVIESILQDRAEEMADGMINTLIN